MGAAIAKAGADRATPLATTTLVVAANAPDIDVASYIGGEYFALAFRRGITHGWPALVILPFLVTAAVLAWDRGVRRRRAPSVEPARAGPVLALAALGVLTHPTLDWMNTYGMRWALPFDGAWSYGDALFIVDPWIWLALGGAVFLASAPSRRGLAAWGLLAAAATALVWLALPSGRWLWVAGLALLAVVHRSGRLRAASAGRMLAGAAAALVTVYITVLVIADGLARRDVLAAARAMGLAPSDVMVAPLPGNPFASDVEVRTAEGYVPGRHRWLAPSRVELRAHELVPLLGAPEGLAAADLERILGAARAEAPVRHYLVWSRLPYTRIEDDGGAWRVTFADARYDGDALAGGLAGVQVVIPPRAGAD